MELMADSTLNILLETMNKQTADLRADLTDSFKELRADMKKNTEISTKAYQQGLKTNGRVTKLEQWQSSFDKSIVQYADNVEIRSGILNRLFDFLLSKQGTFFVISISLAIAALAVGSLGADVVRSVLL